MLCVIGIVIFSDMFYYLESCLSHSSMHSCYILPLFVEMGRGEYRIDGSTGSQVASQLQGGQGEGIRIGINGQTRDGEEADITEGLHR